MADYEDYDYDEVAYDGGVLPHQQLESMTPEQLCDFSATIIQSAIRGALLRNSIRDRMKQHRHRTRVVREIRETEKTYKNSLKILLETVIQPLTWNAEHSAIPIVCKEDVTSMFSNIEQISKLSDELYQLFDERANNWYANQLIGDVFNRYGPFLKIYTIYCNNYDRANEALSRAVVTDSFNQFWESVRAIHINLLSLSSYLIMPVQRIPRYELLLKDLIKSTWPDHPDAANIQTALKLIQNIGGHVNRALGSAEVTLEMMEAQQNFGAYISPPGSVRDSASYGLLSPTRRFIRKGLLKWQKQSTKYENVVLWLFNDIVIISEKVSSATSNSEEHYVYKGHIYLFNDEGEQVSYFEDLRDLGMLKNIFRIYGEESSYTFRTRAKEEKLDWSRAINDTISTLIHLNEQKRSQQSAAATSAALSNIQAFTANTSPRRLPGLAAAGSPSGAVATVLSSIVLPRRTSVNDLTTTTTIARTTAQIVGTADREDSKGKKYTAYIVELNVHSMGQLRRIFKRYSEFDALDKALRGFLLEQGAAGNDAKPGKAVRTLPLLPPKRFLLHTSKELEKRVLALGSYLQSVLIMQDIRTHPAVSLFLEDMDGSITGVRSTSVNDPNQTFGAAGGSNSVTTQGGNMPQLSKAPRVGMPSSEDGAMLSDSTGGDYIDATVTMCSGEELKLTMSSNDKCKSVLSSVFARSGLSFEDKTALGFALYVTTPDELLGLGRMDLHFSRPLEDDEFPLRVLQARQAKSPSAMMILQRAVWCVEADKLVSDASGRLSELLMHQISRDVINGSFILSVNDTTRLAALYAQATVRGGFSRDSAASYCQELEFLPQMHLNALVKDDSNPSTASAQGGVDLRMYGMTTNYDLGDGERRPRLIRLWSRGIGRPAIILEAWHDRDYEKWVSALSKKVALEGSELNEDCVQKLVRLSASQSQTDSNAATTTESPMQRIFTNSMFQGASKQYVTGLMLSECEGWLTKRGRGRSALLGKANWKNRWFVLVGTKLIYFKTVPQMTFKKAMWQELFIRHWNHDAKLQPYQACNEYIKLAQSYPYYGAAYYPVTFDPATAPVGFERAFPSVITLGITYRNVLVMDPVSRAIYAEFEEQHIETIQAFPGDLKVKLFGVDNLVVFHTSLAYDILRLYTAASVFDSILAANKDEAKDAVEISRSDHDQGNKIVEARNNRASKRFTPSSTNQPKPPSRVLSSDVNPTTNPTFGRSQSNVTPAAHATNDDMEDDDDDDDEGGGIGSSIRATMSGTRLRDAIGGGFHPLLSRSRSSKLGLDSGATPVPQIVSSPVATNQPAQRSSFMKSFSRLGNMVSGSKNADLTSIDEKVHENSEDLEIDGNHVKSTFRHDISTADRSLLKQVATQVTPGMMPGQARGFQLPPAKKRTSVDDFNLPNPVSPPPPVPGKHAPMKSVLPPPVPHTSPIITPRSIGKKPPALPHVPKQSLDNSTDNAALPTKLPPPLIKRPSQALPSVPVSISSSASTIVSITSAPHVMPIASPPPVPSRASAKQSSDNDFESSNYAISNSAATDRPEVPSKKIGPPSIPRKVVPPLPKSSESTPSSGKKLPTKAFASLAEAARYMEENGGFDDDGYRDSDGSKPIAPSRPPPAPKKSV